VTSGKGKAKPFLLSHGQTAMTTYNEAVCHAGQHKEKLCTLIIAPCQDTQSAQAWITHIANYTMPAFFIRIQFNATIGLPISMRSEFSPFLIFLLSWSACVQLQLSCNMEIHSYLHQKLFIFV